MRKVRRTAILWATAVVLWIGAAAGAAAEDLKPFLLGSYTKGDFTNTISEVRNVLQSEGFQIAGEYSPYENAHVIVVTDDFLRRLAGQEEGGAYMAGERVSIVRDGDKVQVAYANPVYLANAYRVDADVTPVADRLKRALGYEKGFGAKGLSPSKLRRYHYAFGMEYFDEPLTLAKYDDQREAIRAIEKALDARAGGVAPVYRIDSTNGAVTVFGVAMSEGYSADAKVMSIIDVDELKSAAHLPYEMVVRDGTVQALAPRFRIAISFPDQKMFGENSFMQIMSSPKEIQDALTQAAGKEVKETTSRGGFNF
ncbi:MAG: hypothetical protein PVF91_04925 [Chromatiales bacterium]|jgi:hypothetical protein